jgi:hypothetical protein
MSVSAIRRVVLFASTSVLALTVRGPAGQDSLSVTGRVVSSQTSLPLAAAAVELIGPGTPIRSVTDDDGRFSLSVSQPGYYDLVASKPGYPPAAYEAAGSGRPGVRIALVAGDVADLVLRLAPGAVVAGQVLTAAGEPASEVRVLPVWEDESVPPRLGAYLIGRIRQWVADAASVTDREGRFRIFGLPPGRYGARLTWLRPPRGVFGRDPVSIEAFGGASSLAIGEERSVLLRLPIRPANPPGLLSGRIVTDGTPVASAISVLARREGHESEAVVVGTKTTPMVRFEIERVKPGRYHVEARGIDDRPSPADMLWGAATVDVEPSRSAEFELRLVAAPLTACRVEVADAEILADGLSLLLTPLSPWAPEGAVTMAVGPEGRCGARLAPGRYRVSVLERGRTDAPHWFVESVHRGEDVPTRDLLTIPGPGGASTFLVHATRQPHELAGRLVDANRRPATSFTVLIYPEEPALRAPDLERVRIVRPATDGRFFSGPLAIGRYRIAVLEGPDPGQVIDARFIERADALAISASVDARQSSGLTLRVLK